MLDLLHRPLRDLRVSVTDRCNLRCPYCMPREVFGANFRFLPREELLSFEEITQVVAAMAAHGVSKVRLTGGEPLLRRDLERLIEMLARVEGVSDIALTTNGLLLARNAQRLRDAGLDRVTVSLDALDESALRAMSDTPVSPEQILEGIEAAGRAGLAPVKVNMVVRRAATITACSRWPSAFAAGRRSCASSSSWTSAPPTAGAPRRSCRRARSSRRSGLAGRWSRSPPSARARSRRATATETERARSG